MENEWVRAHRPLINRQRDNALGRETSRERFSKKKPCEINLPLFYLLSVPRTTSAARTPAPKSNVCIGMIRVHPDSPIKPTMRSTGIPSRFNRFSPRQSGFETRIGPCIRVRLVALFFPSFSLFLSPAHPSRELDYVSFNSRSCIQAHGPLIPAFVPLIFRYFCPPPPPE